MTKPQHYRPYIDYDKSSGSPLIKWSPDDDGTWLKRDDETNRLLCRELDEAQKVVNARDETIKALQDGIRAMTKTSSPISPTVPGVEVAALSGNRLVLHCRALLAQGRAG